MKQEHKAMVRARLLRAVGDLYHNATIAYPRDYYGRSDEQFLNWLSGAREFEVEYLQDGGAYGRNPRATFEHPANAGRYKSERAQRYYVRMKMQDMAEERVKAQWERIGEYGRLYQYGRGGRTLAPENCVRTRGGSSFSMREDFAEEYSIAEAVDRIRVLESFNSYVKAWCEGVPDMWREHCADEDAAKRAEARAKAQAKAKETRERHYWEARGVLTMAGA